MVSSSPRDVVVGTAVTGARRRGFALLAGAVLFALASCAPPPPPPPPTVVQLKLVTTADANGPAGGAGVPLALRVYQLSSGGGFQAAEFFPLYKDDKATLAADLIKKDEMILPPGTTKAMTLTPTDQVTALAVFAAYRDFQNTIWRAVAEIPAHKTTAVSVTADATGLKLVAVPVKPGP
jgi:type VI secretion system protein VasD